MGGGREGGCCPHFQSVVHPPALFPYHSQSHLFGHKSQNRSFETLNTNLITSLSHFTSCCSSDKVLRGPCGPAVTPLPRALSSPALKALRPPSVTCAGHCHTSSHSHPTRLTSQLLFCINVNLSLSIFHESKGIYICL